MTHIFLSYSRRDEPAMHRFSAALHEQGFDVWTDVALQPGVSDWEKQIRRAIADSLALVVLLSPEAIESRWVQNEIEYADALRKPIFPVMIRETRLPIQLAARQYVDATRDFDRAIDQLVEVVRTLQSPATAPQAARGSAAAPHERSASYTPLPAAPQSYADSPPARARRRWFSCAIALLVLVLALSVIVVVLALNEGGNDKQTGSYAGTQDQIALVETGTPAPEVSPTSEVASAATATPTPERSPTPSGPSDAPSAIPTVTITGTPIPLDSPTEGAVISARAATASAVAATNDAVATGFGITQEAMQPTQVQAEAMTQTQAAIAFAATASAQAQMIRPSPVPRTPTPNQGAAVAMVSELAEVEIQTRVAEGIALALGGTANALRVTDESSLSVAEAGEIAALIAEATANQGGEDHTLLIVTNIGVAVLALIVGGALILTRGGDWSFRPRPVRPHSQAHAHGRAPENMPPPMEEFQVFISSSDADKSWVGRFVRDLGDLGYLVWWYAKDAPGLPFGQEIVRAIFYTKVFVVIVSPDSMKSKHVEEEIRLADRYDRPIITAIYRLTDERIYGLAKSSDIDFSNSYEYKNAMEFLTQAIDTFLERHQRATLGTGPADTTAADAAANTTVDSAPGD